jgi:cell division septum initiation protein DivIVA
MSRGDDGTPGRAGARPEFAVTWRGYDRRQVDRFAERQLALLDEARRSVHEARDVAGAQPTFPEPETSRVRSLTATPRSFEDLGDQVGRILREAWTVAESIRADARREAAEIVRAAHDEARRVMTPGSAAG